MRSSSTHRGWARYSLGLPLVIALVALSTAGCGLTSADATSTAPQGIVQGKVVAGPTCPVENADQLCQPVPVKGRSVSIETPRGAVADTTTTDDHGQFSATLAPGAYVIKVAMISGQPGVRQNTPGDVTVAAGKTIQVTITLDTGLRKPSTP